MEDACDCRALTMPLHYTVLEDGTCGECPTFGVVFVDDVPVGTGRISERGEIADVEWDTAALGRLGLTIKDMER